MDTTPPPAPAPQHPAGSGPSGTDSFFDAIRRTHIVRSDERWVGGVAGGLALRAGIDPIVVRGLFALASFLGGLGLIAYAVGWALLPEQRDGRIHLQELFRGHFDVAILGAFIALAAGLSAPERWVPWWSGWSGGEWWGGLFWLGALVLVVVLVTSSRKGTGPSTPLPPTPPPPAGPAGQPVGRPTAGTTPSSPSSPMAGYAPGPTTAAFPAARTEGPLMDSTTPHSAAYTTAYTYGAGPTPGSAGPAGGGTSGGAGGYGGASYSYQGPPVAPPPPRPRVLGPGSTTVSIVFGLGLLTLAGLWYAQRIDAFDGPVLLTAGAVTVVLAGIGIIVAGLRGRNSGGLGALAIVTAVVMVPLAFVTRADWPDDWSWDGTSAGVGEIRNTPETIAEAEEGYSVGAGQAQIDLTQLELGDEVVEIPISVGAGEVLVTMPRDGAFSADIQVFAGEVSWLGDRVQSGFGQQGVEYESPAVEAGAEPQIVLDISVGAGEVRVVEATR